MRNFALLLIAGSACCKSASGKNIPDLRVPTGMSPEASKCAALRRASPGSACGALAKHAGVYVWMQGLRLLLQRRSLCCPTIAPWQGMLPCRHPEGVSRMSQHNHQQNQMSQQPGQSQPSQSGQKKEQQQQQQSPKQQQPGQQDRKTPQSHK